MRRCWTVFFPRSHARVLFCMCCNFASSVTVLPVKASPQLAFAGDCGRVQSSSNAGDVTIIKLQQSYEPLKQELLYSSTMGYAATLYGSFF